MPAAQTLWKLDLINLQQSNQSLSFVVYLSQNQHFSNCFQQEVLLLFVQGCRYSLLVLSIEPQEITSLIFLYYFSQVFLFFSLWFWGCREMDCLHILSRFDWFRGLYQKFLNMNLNLAETCYVSTANQASIPLFPTKFSVCPCALPFCKAWVFSFK